MSMSRSVYVLGAGFTHNFNSEVFPLVRDFLKTPETDFVSYVNDVLSLGSHAG